MLATGLSAHVCIHPCGLDVSPLPDAKNPTRPATRCLPDSTELLENHVEEVVLPVLLARFAVVTRGARSPKLRVRSRLGIGPCRGRSRQPSLPQCQWPRTGPGEGGNLSVRAVWQLLLASRFARI